MLLLLSSHVYSNRISSPSEFIVELLSSEELFSIVFLKLVYLTKKKQICQFYSMNISPLDVLYSAFLKCVIKYLILDIIRICLKINFLISSNLFDPVRRFIIGFSCCPFFDIFIESSCCAWCDDTTRHSVIGFLTLVLVTTLLSFSISRKVKFLVSNIL